MKRVKWMILSATVVVCLTGLSVVNLASLRVPDHQSSATVVPDGKMLGIHRITLKDGISSDMFEQFVVEEFHPNLWDIFPGIHLRIMKGERNAEAGEYLLVYDIQSRDVRDFYFPQPGVNNAAASGVFERCNEACDTIWQKYSDMIDRSDWADYYELTELSR